ncbi:hypothetical protein [Methylomonas sp. DH-1]|uniref:hypothetical protein n=1 Tax=Methylomonas sp. (strain DH-1) TaxID=1727196 RepID=UPI0007C943B8|nr:hypothetical protein [Methylomonas sp. DH-1]ANE56597.1 hypothetical protein AYM39_16385 [Methylomonas sp. DH-1]
MTARVTYRLMTKDQYSKDLMLGQDDNIKVFQLRTPNVIAIAMAIQNLYAPRVRLSFNPVMGSGMGGFGGMGMGGFGGAGGGYGGLHGSNAYGFNRAYGYRDGRNSQMGGMGNLTFQDQLPNNMSVDQIEQLSTNSQDGKQIDSEKLAEVAGANKVVFVTVNQEHYQLTGSRKRRARANRMPDICCTASMPPATTWPAGNKPTTG